MQILLAKEYFLPVEELQGRMLAAGADLLVLDIAHGHPGGGLAHLGRIAVDLGILEAVADVRRPRVEQDQPPAVGHPETLGWIAVVLAVAGALALAAGPLKRW